MSEISEEDARWKPAADRFSIAEVLSHLSHSEAHCYRARLDRFLAEERPEFEPDDAQMHLDVYRNADPEEDFGHFEASVKPTSSCCGACPRKPAAARRCIGRPVRSRTPRCCTSGRFTISGTSGRSRSWCAPGNISRGPAHWAKIIS